MDGVREGETAQDVHTKQTKERKKERNIRQRQLRNPRSVTHREEEERTIEAEREE